MCLHKNALKVHPGFKIQYKMLKFLNFYMHFYNIFIHPTSTLGNPPPKKIVVLSFPVTMFDNGNHHLQWTLLFSSNTFLYMYIKHNSRLHQQSDLLCRLVKLFLIDRLYKGDVEDATLKVQSFLNFVDIGYIPLPTLAISRLILLE